MPKSGRNPNGVMMYAELKQILCEDCKAPKKVRFYKTAKKCPECAEKARIQGKSERRANRRKNDPEKHSRQDFKQDLRRNYGLTIETYKEMYESQKGCCACCGRHESEFKRGLHVDHCHTTGQVRGLLCTRCNPGLGYFRDSVENLEMAIAYLKKFKKAG